MNPSVSIKPIRVGVIGCGNISSQYFDNLVHQEKVQISACSDINLMKAEQAALNHGIPTACTTDEIMKDPDIDLVINLTLPLNHAEISLNAITSGKHVYTEKPLAVNREDAEAILMAAQKNGVSVGSAPDTFLGGGIQTCLSLLKEGAIGQPIGATAFMLNHGHEHWHPEPHFYYRKGGGPMFDMGPYYLTALVCLLGPIARVSGTHKKGFATRTITSQPHKGESIDVGVSTHIAGSLDFESGALATIVTSFDVKGSQFRHMMEIYGTEGTLKVPDPNTFGGPVMIRRDSGSEWELKPLLHENNGRGLGVIDMASALIDGLPSRVDANMANHILDVIHLIHESSEEGKHLKTKSSCEQPSPTFATNL